MHCTQKEAATNSGRETELWQEKANRDLPFLFSVHRSAAQECSLLTEVQMCYVRISPVACNCFPTQYFGASLLIFIFLQQLTVGKMFVRSGRRMHACFPCFDSSFWGTEGRFPSGNNRVILILLQTVMLRPIWILKCFVLQDIMKNNYNENLNPSVLIPFSCLFKLQTYHLFLLFCSLNSKLIIALFSGKIQVIVG